MSEPASLDPRARELGVVGKAAFSSLAATLADGCVYQLLLFALVGHYAIAAAFGAVAGACVNFGINRHYTFARSTDRLLPQALRYIVVSVTTYFALRFLLQGFVEGLRWSPRVAWLPAKLLAFAVISYPLQRVWVFGAERPS